MRDLFEKFKNIQRPIPQKVGHWSFFSLTIQVKFLNNQRFSSVDLFTYIELTIKHVGIIFHELFNFLGTPLTAPISLF